MENKQCWVDIPENSDFTIHNLPYGIFTVGRKTARAGVAIGEMVLDLYEVANLGFFDELKIAKAVFKKDSLNDFIALGKATWSALRTTLQKLLTAKNSPLKKVADKVLVAQAEVTMLMPVQVGDYTDFYSSIEHATNLGCLFRDPKNALLPNWRHLPVGYHGRASSICVSGTEIRRPKGQQIPKDSTQPVFGPSKLLDIELEMAFVIGKNTEMGSSVTTDTAADHIFGMVIFNDWSARDIQKWEYIPLGPFLGKSFASSISPWIVTMEALAPFKVAGPKQEPEVLPYLQYQGKQNYNIKLEVALQPEGAKETVISKSNFRYMYWNMHQQLAHHTVNGCNVKVGDMMASGTISGKTNKSYGSMLEMTWAGKNPIKLKGGDTRKFLQDHDTVIMRAHAKKGDIRVGFGEVVGKILPAV